MKKIAIMIILGLCLPLTSMAGNVKPNIFEWLNKNLIYPTTAVENKEAGTVYVSFIVTENGKAENVIIEHGISNALNEAALKAVNNMPLTELYNTENPEYVYVLPIRFTLK